MFDKTRKVKFTVPTCDGSVSLEHCIKKRRSVRDFRDQSLTKNQLGQLLWAAQGITATDGKRAVSSAGALYPLELYAVCGNVTSLAPGVYHYIAERHELISVVCGHWHENLVIIAGGQEWISSAPAVICVAAIFERTTIKYGSRGCGYVYIEAGHAAENLMLEAIALGLATTIVGALNDDEVKDLFHLAANEDPLCLVPIGAP